MELEVQWQDHELGSYPLIVLTLEDAMRGKRIVVRKLLSSNAPTSLYRVPTPRASLTAKPNRIKGSRTLTLGFGKLIFLEETIGHSHLEALFLLQWLIYRDRATFADLDSPLKRVVAHA
jgi:hypothetical protein